LTVHSIVVKRSILKSELRLKKVSTYDTTYCLIFYVTTLTNKSHKMGTSEYRDLYQAMA